MIRRMIACAVLAVTATGLQACESGSVADPGEVDPVVWSQSVCQSVLDGGAQLADLPMMDPRNPAKTKANVVGYLGKLSAALKGTESALLDAGSPPVDNGIDAYGKALKTIESIQGGLATARKRLKQAEVTDGKALQDAMRQAGKSMAKANNSGPMKDLAANQELSAAFAQSQTCRQVI